VNSRDDGYRRVPGTRLTDIDNFRIGFVYTPTNPELYSLNLAALAILDLCDGRPAHALEEAFLSLVTGKAPSEDVARQWLSEGVERLLSIGAIERVAAADD